MLASKHDHRGFRLTGVWREASSCFKTQGSLILCGAIRLRRVKIVAMTVRRLLEAR